jgi:hypothetical protein
MSIVESGGSDREHEHDRREGEAGEVDAQRDQDCARERREPALGERRSLCAFAERSEDHEREAEDRVDDPERDERCLPFIVEQSRQEAADADRDGERSQPRRPPRQQVRSSAR